MHAGWRSLRFWKSLKPRCFQYKGQESVSLPQPKVKMNLTWVTNTHPKLVVFILFPYFCFSSFLSTFSCVLGYKFCCPHCVVYNIYSLEETREMSLCDFYQFLFFSFMRWGVFVVPHDSKWEVRHVPESLSNTEHFTYLRPQTISYTHLISLVDFSKLLKVRAWSFHCLYCTEWKQFKPICVWKKIYFNLQSETRWRLGEVICVESVFFLFQD